MTRYVASIVIATWGVLWTALAYAQVVAPETLQGLPWISVAIAGGIAAWGGLVVTLNRLTNEMLPTEFVKWFVRDVISAMVAGWFVYFVAGWAGWNVWFQALVLLAAGYGGSKILDAAAKRLLKGIKEAEV